MEARRPQSALPSRKRDWTLGDEPQQDSRNVQDDAKLFSPIRDVTLDFTDLERFSKFARNPQRPSSAPPRQHDSSVPGASSAGLVGRRLFSQTGADSGNAFLPSLHSPLFSGPDHSCSRDTTLHALWHRAQGKSCRRIYSKRKQP